MLRQGRERGSRATLYRSEMGQAPALTRSGEENKIDCKGDETIGVGKGVPRA